MTGSCPPEMFAPTGITLRRCQLQHSMSSVTLQEAVRLPPGAAVVALITADYPTTTGCWVSANAAWGNMTPISVSSATENLRIIPPIKFSIKQTESDQLAFPKPTAESNLAE